MVIQTQTGLFVVLALRIIDIRRFPLHRASQVHSNLRLPLCHCDNLRHSNACQIEGSERACSQPIWFLHGEFTP